MYIKLQTSHNLMQFSEPHGLLSVLYVNIKLNPNKYYNGILVLNILKNFTLNESLKCHIIEVHGGQ